MKNLCFLTDEILSLLELKEDRLFEKIPKEKISYYIDEANKIGRDVAIKYKNENIESLLKNNGVSIIIKDHCQSKNLDIRGEITFDEKERQIVIYKNSMEQIIEALKKYGFNISKEEVYNIHLAHEFYHFLEFKNEENTNNLLDRIEVDFIGPIKRKSTILKTREIAAHAFCKELLNLNFHPKILDYIYLIETKKINLKEFKEYINELELKFQKE